MNNNMQAYFFYQLRIVFILNNGILTMEVNFSMQVRQVKDSVSVGKRIWCTQTPLLLMGSNQECMPWPNRGNSSQVNDMSKSYSFCLKVDEWVKKVRVFGGVFCGNLWLSQNFSVQRLAPCHFGKSSTTFVNLGKLNTFMLSKKNE